MKNKILVLSAALLAMGLASCTAQAPEEESSSAAPSTSQPASNPSVAPSENPSADPSVAPSSQESSGYNWNVIDSQTTLKILAWDRYCEVNDANADEKAKDDAGCEGKGTAHVDALVSAFIATLPAETTVRVGVYHSTTYANDPVAALANEYDVVIGAGAKISPTYGATNRKAINDMLPETNAYLATQTGRKAALMSETDDAILAYKWLTGVEYKPATPESETPSSQPTSETPEPSSEPSSETPEPSSEPSSETSHPEIAEHDLVIGYYNKPSTSGVTENVLAKYQAALSTYVASVDPTKTDIVFKGYDGNVATSCGQIETALSEEKLLPDILVGWKANLAFTAESQITYNTLSDEGGSPIAFTVGEEGVAVKTDRYLITLQCGGSAIKDLTNKVVEWMQTEEGRAATYIAAA